MEQRQSAGYLSARVPRISYNTYEELHQTHDAIAFVMRGSIQMALPSASSGGAMLKTCKLMAMLMNSDTSAKYLPGQMLSHCQPSQEHGRSKWRTGDQNRTNSSHPYDKHRVLIGDLCG